MAIDIKSLSYKGQSIAPSVPAIGNYKTYFKEDGKMYYQDSTGLETEVGSGSGVVDIPPPEVINPFKQGAHAGLDFYYGDACFKFGDTFGTTDAGFITLPDNAITCIFMDFNDGSLFTEALISENFPEPLEASLLYVVQTAAGEIAFVGDSRCILSAIKIQRGSTVNRPSDIVIGYQYFDTTLNKPIWHSGTNWVDATGTVV